MFIPFLPRDEVKAVLDEAYQAEEVRDEYEADLGASLFYSGMTSWDAMTMARQDSIEREEVFRASEEGELYFARLEAARFFDRAITRDMKVSIEGEVNEFGFRPHGTTTIPVFDPAKPFQLFEGVFILRADEDIPF